MNRYRSLLTVLLIASAALPTPHLFASVEDERGVASGESLNELPFPEDANSESGVESAGRNGPGQASPEAFHETSMHGHHCSDGHCPHPHPHHRFTITKHAVVADGGAGVDQVGDVIKYTVAITNTGTASLTVTLVYDTFVQLAGPPQPVVVAPGGILTYTGQYVVQPDDLRHRSISNTVTAETIEAGCQSATAVIPVIPTAPCDYNFTVKKTASIAGGATEVCEVGQVINYSVIVTNTGNRPLTLLTVLDPHVKLTGPTPPPAMLAVGAHAVYTGSYKVKPADLHKQFIENTVTATTNEAGSKNDSALVKIGKGDCPECKCKNCCKWVLEEFVVPQDVKVRKCYTVHIPQEKTVPYCCKECKDGKCIEVLGTKTVRQFVETKKIKEVVEQEPKICKVWVHKCVTCGVEIKDCPEVPYSSADADVHHRVAPILDDGGEPGPIDEMGSEATTVEPAVEGSEAEATPEPAVAGSSRPVMQLVSTKSARDSAKQAASGETSLLAAALQGIPRPANLPHADPAKCCTTNVPDAKGSKTPAQPDWSDLNPNAPLGNCTKCRCEQCCTMIADEDLKPIIVKAKVCVHVYQAEDMTKAYCDVKCEDGDCIEVIGTKTRRHLVRRIEEREIKLKKWVVYTKAPEERCLKCGYDIKYCPEQHKHAADDFGPREE